MQIIAITQQQQSNIPRTDSQTHSNSDKQIFPQEKGSSKFDLCLK